jgi:hypothetical protein
LSDLVAVDLRDDYQYYWQRVSMMRSDLREHSEKVSENVEHGHHEVDLSVTKKSLRVRVKGDEMKKNGTHIF